jgi:16S rRNA G966 N2-methylase RsmD
VAEEGNYSGQKTRQSGKHFALSTLAAVRSFLSEPPIDEDWQKVHLKPIDCAERILKDDTKPAFFERLSDRATAAWNTLVEAGDIAADLAEEWLQWLKDNERGDAWDLGCLGEKRDDLEDRLRERQKVDTSDPFVHGDFRTVAATIENDSVELIFTDPPYDSDSVPLYGDLAEMAAKKLVDGGSLICYCGHRLIPKILPLMTEHLSFYWIVACVHTGQCARMPMTGQVVKWKPMLWFTKGANRFDSSVFVDDLIESAPEKDTHAWQQGIIEASYYIEKLTTKAGLVFDPFCGGGTTALAAHQLGRQFITCDIDEAAIAAAKERFDNAVNG